MIIVSSQKRYKENVGFNGYLVHGIEIGKSDESVSNCSKHEGDIYV